MYYAMLQAVDGHIDLIAETNTGLERIQDKRKEGYELVGRIHSDLNLYDLQTGLEWKPRREMNRLYGNMKKVREAAAEAFRTVKEIQDSVDKEKAARERERKLQDLRYRLSMPGA